jgi:hypothetical protein
MASKRVLTPNFHGDPTQTTRGSTLTTRASTLVISDGRRREGCKPPSDLGAQQLAASLHAWESMTEEKCWPG